MYCLYFHFKPDGEIFYVGIGGENRPFDFVNARNEFWHNVVQKHGNPTVKIVLENLSWDHACYTEKYCIKMFGRRDQNSGTLVNMTDGGDGCVNWGTHKQRSERTLKGQTSMTPEQRSANAKKGNDSQTPEQRSERQRKALLSQTQEQRSDRGKKMNSVLTPEQKSLRITNAWASLSKEQRAQRAKNMWISRRANKLNQQK